MFFCDLVLSPQRKPGGTITRGEERDNFCTFSVFVCWNILQNHASSCSCFEYSSLLCPGYCIDQNTKRESGRKVQLGNIQAAKVDGFLFDSVIV